MRILITGADGFVGRWLQEAARAAGHVPIPAPSISELDIADRQGVTALLDSVRPDAIAHLAGVAFAPDAAADASYALRTNAGGTLAVIEACRLLGLDAAILVVGSSEIYAPPLEGAHLTEKSPLGPQTHYGLTKLAAEGVALWGAAMGLHVVVARSFNHTGPGQRRDFVVPAVAARILAAKRSGARTVQVGNLDVTRDIGDVRDTVRAYVMIMEALATGGDVPHPPVVNVATGRGTLLRDLAASLARFAEWHGAFVTDEALLRASDPPAIVGSHRLITEWTGWHPIIALEQTLEDVIASGDA